MSYTPAQMYSLIIPVYRNRDSLSKLVSVLINLNKQLESQLECVFVIDGDPENEFELLSTLLPKQDLRAQLIRHSKNFGSFAAIRTGLEQAEGQYFATMSADLQEPPELALKVFHELAKNETDVVIANRIGRADRQLSSRWFWWVYRKFIQPEMPAGGVDMFGCNQTVRDVLVQLKESNSSLVSLLFWIGFRQKTVDYRRQRREYGASAWTFSRKMKYMVDSIFAFSDIPIRLLIFLGIFGITISFGLSVVVLLSKLVGNITVPGYTATLLIVAFFSSLNIFSFGIIGLYLWRTFENTKQRPNSIVMTIKKFRGRK